MKFKTPKMQNFTDSALKLGSGVAGAVASNIAVSKLTETKTTTTATDKTPDEEKKEANKKKIVKGAIAAASLIGVACIDGNDTSASLVRSALIGSGIMQSISLAKEFVKDTDHKKYGLACPCSGQTSYLAQPEWFEDYSYQPTGGFSYADYSDDNYTTTTQETSTNPLVGFSV